MDVGEAPLPLQLLEVVDCIFFAWSEHLVAMLSEPSRIINPILRLAICRRPP